MIKFEFIKGFDNRYSISRSGIVVSNPKLVVRPPKGPFWTKSKRLKIHINHKGYYTVALSLNGKSKTYILSRLVAIQFIPNPHNKPTVNHKNGIKTDNRVSNLEWSTYKENSRHAFDSGLHSNQRPVKSIDSKGNIVGVYPSINKASRETGLSVTGIHQALTGAVRGNMHANLKWVDA